MDGLKTRTDRDLEEHLLLRDALIALVDEAGGTAEEKGWHEKDVSFGERIALMHSELSEALESYRVSGEVDDYTMQPDGKPEGVLSELADVVIRIGDLVYVEDLAAAFADTLLEKLAYNRTRPHRHGGKHL